MSDCGAPPLIEPIYCADIYADGIAKVEMAGGQNVRLWYYVDTVQDGRPVRMVVAKMVRPISLLVTNKILSMVDRTTEPDMAIAH